MTVSLLMVTHNDADSYLPFVLASIERNIGQAQIEEFIVWDNASDEPHREVLERLANCDKVKVIFSQENLYDLPAVNELMKIAKGAYVLYLNSHTRVVLPVSLKRLITLFNSVPSPAMLGSRGPCLKASEATPHGVEGWGWIPRLLVERDFFQSPEETTLHVQTWCFFTRPDVFLYLGGFEIREQRFDMRWPEKRFPKRAFKGDKGALIAAEIEFSVRARRRGYNLIFPLFRDFPFYHYPSGLNREKILELEKRFPPVTFGPWFQSVFRRLVP